MGDAKFFGKQIALLDKEIETLKAKGKEDNKAAEDKYKALSSSADDKYFVLHDEDGTNVRIILFIKANYKDLATKLGKRIQNVEYVNQAALAARKFGSAIYENDERPDVEPDGMNFPFKKFRMDPLAAGG